MSIKAIPYETYFGEMDIEEDRKRERIELASILEKVFISLFVYIKANLKAGNELSKDECVDYLQRRYLDAIDDNSSKLSSDYIQQYVSDYSRQIVDVTFRHIDDEFYLSKDRAMLIAENESNLVLNYKDEIIAKENGFTFKTWQTMRDRSVRESHEELQGETILIDDVFDVGNYKMRFPKDTSLGASRIEIEGCRCWVTYS